MMFVEPLVAKFKFWYVCYVLCELEPRSIVCYLPGGSFSPVSV